MHTSNRDPHFVPAVSNYAPRSPWKTAYLKRQTGERRNISFPQWSVWTGFL
jgi:hypothetical protein